MMKWKLDTESGIPLYLQLKQYVVSQIIQGTWKIGYQLPTVRQMAVTMSVNVNTITRVYNDVERDGYIQTVQGKGTFVTDCKAWRNKAKSRKDVVAEFAELVLEMAQGQGVSPTELIRSLNETGSIEHD